ncbi:glutathione S-transferase family protein [Methylovirgula sp. 4M-Z18]|uniref:glutathione S-transferase family protein n=1 Tax=Methylovirgula sp. 4M-Z18 TaxID=2293567 RepID=UPI000E2FF25E|nr:glutathione S-transferase family protein [Methylovirgula sp. 4M-Z18]RFB79530.1 glutathione S-transferase family protein [Methylovirgula sp. 4M-Z18]
MLTIWGRKSSSNVQALMWCVGELQLAFERIDAGFTYGVIDTPEFRALNPNGTIPVLRDGDDPPLWETGAILRYLAGRYGSESFWPKNDKARATVDKWAEWSKINIAGNFTGPVFWRVVRMPAAQRNPAAIGAALETLDRFLDVAEQQLAQNAHLAGPDFTLADIQFGHCLYRYFDIEIARKNRPHLQAYYASLASRPAFQEHVIVSYDELRDRLN